MSLTKIGVVLLATATIGMTQTAEADTTEQVDVITTAQPCDNKKTIVTVAETQEQQPTQEEISQQEQQANTWTCDKCGQQIQNNIPKEVHDKAMHAEQQAEPQEETGTQYDGICEKCGSTFVGPYNEHVCQK